MIIQLHNLWYDIKQFDWLHLVVILIALAIAFGVFYTFSSNWFEAIDSKSILSNILTVNAVFSTILITYLFSRITWSKERKLDTLKEAIILSQKITDFRRILDKLTRFYKVWADDKATKSLIDHGEFKYIDFYDYHLIYSSQYRSKDNKLIKQLYNHENFIESQSTLYLAMVSLVRNRKVSRLKPQDDELYKDFNHDRLCNIKIVEKWLEVGIFGRIWFWLNEDNQYINYEALNNHKDYILAAACRINKKYEGQELSDTLIKELADDFNSHYLKELYIKLKELKKGVADLNLLILSLITVSLIFGVLFPIILMFVSSQSIWYVATVAALASINSGIISYFILRFPTLINNELKWI